MTRERRCPLPAPPEPERPRRPLPPRPLGRASLARIGLVFSLFLGACDPANTAPPPSVPPPSTDSRRPDLSPGSPLLVRRGALWLPSRVVGPAGPDRVVVQFEGYGPEWNEAVTFDRIKARPLPLLARDYRIGERVLVLAASNKLFVAEIVQQVAPYRWRVHYDGYGPEVAEDVGPDRLRRPHAGPSALALGQPVGVRAGTSVLPAKVVAIVASDRFIVRFDGMGPESDQEIGPDRLDALPAPAAMGSDRYVEPLASPQEAALMPPEAASERSMKPGAEVFVSHRGAYHSAIVIAAGTDGMLRVRYAISRDGVAEESIPLARVRPAPPEFSGAAPLKPDQAVFIEWHGMFFSGRVVRAAGKGLYRVRFDGVGPETDEVVPARRLRATP